MKKTFASALLASIYTLSTPISFAEDPLSYNFATIQLVTQDLVRLNCDQDGLRIGGNYEVKENIFALGSFTDLSGSDCGSETFSIGAGYHEKLNETTSFFGSVSFVNTDVDAGESDSGLSLSAGLRMFFSEEIEGRTSLTRVTTFSGETILSTGISYHFHEQFSFHGDINFGSETNSVAAGIRYDY